MRHSAGAYLGKWAKRGNDFYRTLHLGDRDEIIRWNMASAPMSEPAASNLAVGHALLDIFRTADKLWGLSTTGTLIEFDPSTLAVVTTYATGLTEKLIGFHAVSDTRFFILENRDTFQGFVHMFDLPSVTLTQLNPSPFGDGCPPVSVNHNIATTVGFHFSSGYFYISDAGQGGGGTSTGRLGPILCPDGSSIYGGFDF
jgi:hypothetical protein